MFQRGRTGMWRTASAPRAWAQCGHPWHQFCRLLMGEIMAALCPFSGCIGKPLLLPAAAPAGRNRTTTWALELERGLLTATRLKLVSPISIPGIDIVSICPGHPPGFFEKARCFSRCKMSLMALFGPDILDLRCPLMGAIRTSPLNAGAFESGP
jgi:hypothetical protein